jgi:hypothetical protein
MRMANGTVLTTLDFETVHCVPLENKKQHTRKEKEKTVESEPTVQNEIVHDPIDAREPLLPPDIVAGLNPPCRYMYDIWMLTPKDGEVFQIPNKPCFSAHMLVIST